MERAYEPSEPDYGITYMEHPDERLAVEGVNVIAERMRCNDGTLGFPCMVCRNPVAVPYGIRAFDFYPYVHVHHAVCSAECNAKQDAQEAEYPCFALQCAADVMEKYLSAFIDRDRESL